MFEWLKRLFTRTTVVEGKRVSGAVSFQTGETSQFYTRGLSAESLRYYYRESSVVRSCVDEIALTVADLPLIIKTKAGDVETIKKRVFGKAPTGETFREVLYSATVDLVVLDKCVILPVFTTSGRLSGFVSRDAATFYPVKDESGVLKGYIQRITYPRSYVEKFEPNEVIFVQGFPKTYSLQGTPIIESLTYEAASLIQSMLRLYERARGQGNVPVGLLAFEETLGDDVVQRLQQDLSSLVRGEGGKIPIVWGTGKAAWVQLTQEFFSREIVTLFDKFDWLVRRAFGYIPPSASLLVPGGEPLPYSTLVPHIAKALEVQLNEFLSQFGIEIRFQVLPPITFSEVMAGVRAGLISPNDARRYLRLPPVEGGDQLTILNPMGLTPVGGFPFPTEIPPEQPPPEEIPEKGTEEEGGEEETKGLFVSPVQLERKVQPEKLRNLALMENPKLAWYVTKRTELAEKFVQTARELHEEFKREFSERVVLQRIIPSYLSLYDKTMARLEESFNQFTPEAIDLGYSYASFWWDPDSYSRSEVDRQIAEAVAYYKNYMFAKWNQRLEELHRKAEERRWDEVEKDLDRLLQSFMFGLSLIAAFSLLPLVMISRFFEVTTGKIQLLRWVGILDKHTCRSCAPMIGRVFRPDELVAIDMWPGHNVLCALQQRCRCTLEPVEADTQALTNPWINRKISLREIFDKATHVKDLIDIDDRPARVLTSNPRLREDAYFLVFDAIKMSPSVKRPTYDLRTNTLLIPYDASDAEILEAFCNAFPRAALYRLSTLDPEKPLYVQLQGLLNAERREAWRIIRDRVPSEWEEDWFRGRVELFARHNVKAPLPLEAYRDPVSYFQFAFRSMVTDYNYFINNVPSAVPFQELLASYFWTPSSYEKWMRRVLRYRHVPWRAQVSPETILKNIEFEDDFSREFVDDILRRYPALRVPHLWEGVKRIRIARGVPSRYDATFVTPPPLKDFEASFEGVIVSEPDDFKFLHELGHHVYQRHVRYYAPFRTAADSIYLYKILAKIVAQSPTYLVTLPPRQRAEAIALVKYIVEAESPEEIHARLLAVSDEIVQKLVKPVLNRQRNALALPIRPYAVKNSEEAFAELFATFFREPSVLYYTDSELFRFMESYLYELATFKRSPAWRLVARELRKAGIPLDRAEELTAKIFKEALAGKIDLAEFVKVLREAVDERTQKLAEENQEFVDEIIKTLTGKERS